MKNVEIMNKLSGAFYKVGFQLKKHSPEIMVAVGVVGTVVSAVMACKATTKVNAILEDAKDSVDAIHDCMEDENFADKYNQEDCKKALAITYLQTGAKLAKLYAPSVALGALSIASIITSNNILRKRNIALAAAYATVDKSFKEYRGRVIERFGEEVDKQLKYNVKPVEIEETIVDEKGKEKKVKKTVNVLDQYGYSEYSKIFDELNDNWDNSAEYNMMFLKSRQNYANDLLRTKKRLFLNEVYEMLGFEPTKAGQVVGWIYDEENPTGDNYVDFGIFNIHREASRNFVNGYEPAVILDFNVDGNVWETMA